jgi:hypothetical protein
VSKIMTVLEIEDDEDFKNGNLIIYNKLSA